mmetsp:Transcript_5543/g.7488  ORF Transcript_5543/g.7488 Transcript_5543/m.7488 type:complete len:205 (-) Transcript_5543:63-677(-)|eukprot:CAMPEP_0196594292 /NCGR_PEP_ID=MMETSP1081-20130531/77918_1 /TAXON_ID=36882 /ORGANISM="Pyramimonas amylifera, Strain CCMP720" /LENGTH=204 /DNA_ID=CAMNT_0041918517 /DNA_START=45 /DNA_END=659 /DNA_ORIENTATION=-
MPIRREYEEYWEDIDRNFVEVPAVGGVTAYRRHLPPWELRRQHELEARLREVEQQLKETQQQRKEVQAVRDQKAELVREQQKLQQLKHSEELLQARVRAQEENARMPGCRPGFQRPYSAERATNSQGAIYEANEHWGVGVPIQRGQALHKNREKGERWGVNPLMGGGHTINLHKANQSRENQEARVKEIQQGLSENINKRIARR